MSIPVQPEKIQLPLFAGVDVGGTNVKVGLVDDAGQIVASTKFPTQQELGPRYAIEQARSVFDQLMDDLPFSWSAVEAAGLGTPGPMDIPNGLILTPTNLPGWHNFPVRDELSKALGLPFAFANDAAAAAYGEYWVGAGRDHGSLVLLTLGTGVGGGIIVNDFSIDGAHSHGAEVGHIVVDTSEEARRCSCGQRGHLEAYASATAIVQRTHERLANERQSLLVEKIGEASPLSALMISEAAAAGDALALEIVDETAVYLGRGMTILAHIINPAGFLLGGAVNFGGSESELGQRFLKRIREEVKQNSFTVIGQNLSLEFAKLGSEAGFVGAAGLGRVEHMNQSPQQSA